VKQKGKLTNLREEKKDMFGFLRELKKLFLSFFSFFSSAPQSSGSNFVKSFDRKKCLLIPDTNILLEIFEVGVTTIGKEVTTRISAIALSKDASWKKKDLGFLIHPLVFFEFLKVVQEREFKVGLKKSQKERIKRFVNSLKDSFSGSGKPLRRASRIIGIETCWLSSLANLDLFSFGVYKKVHDLSSKATMIDSISMKDGFCPRSKEKLSKETSKKRGDAYVFLRYVEDLYLEMKNWDQSKFNLAKENVEKRVFHYLTNLEKIKSNSFNLEIINYGDNEFFEYNLRIENVYDQLVQDLKKVKGSRPNRDKMELFAFVIAFLQDDQKFNIGKSTKRKVFHLFFENKAKWLRLPVAKRAADSKKQGNRPFFNWTKEKLRVHVGKSSKKCVLKPIAPPQGFLDENQEWRCLCGEIYERKELFGKVKEFETRISTADVFIASSAAPLKRLGKDFFIVSRDGHLLSILKSYGLSEYLMNPWKGYRY